jgi:magnesium transporter
MIRYYLNDSGRLQPVDSMPELRDDLVWIDLLEPTAEEDAEVEKLLGIAIPTREDMQAIEVSARLYEENGTTYMTATLPALMDSDEPSLGPVTFVLTLPRLITIRYHEPRAFTNFAQRAIKSSLGCTSGDGVLNALLDSAVDRIADVLERAGTDIDLISRRIFRHSATRPMKTRELHPILSNIGRKGDLTSKIRDSLVTLERLVGYFNQSLQLRDGPKEIRESIRTTSQDLRALADHATFLSQKITFLLDATLGMVNIEQNAIIKIFSVAAVVFLPPTLLASIYGMNFTHMPELDWRIGYPLALALMVVSAILPYLFFKRRGWL